MADIVPRLQQEGDVMKLAGMLVLDEGDVVRLVRAGQPDRKATVGRVNLLGQREVEDRCKEAGDTVDIGAIEQKMVEAAGAHAAWIFRPYIGVAR